MIVHTEEKKLNNRPVTLVVADDDASLREAISISLRGKGFNVFNASDGKEALDLVLSHLPDIVIADIIMPVMNGISLCNEIKSNPMTAHISVIMMTGNNTQEIHIEGLENGADDYIAKPFLLTLLELRIHNILEHQKVLRDKFIEEFLNLKITTAKDESEQQFLDHAYKVVEKRFRDQGFRPEDFADALHLSMRNLQRKLKRVADSTPMKFISEARMAEAARLLAGSDLSVTEISFEVGCDDSSNFTKLFKHHFDICPSHYRSQHRSQHS